jgi:hypothetical protein
MAASMKLSPSTSARRKQKVFSFPIASNGIRKHSWVTDSVFKNIHQNWIPAAIKSVLTTTADIVDNRKGPILDTATASGRADDIFATGAGHINPDRAADRGLIYDIDIEDYLGYLYILQ